MSYTAHATVPQNQCHRLTVACTVMHSRDCYTTSPLTHADYHGVVVWDYPICIYRTYIHVPKPTAQTNAPYGESPAPDGKRTRFLCTGVLQPLCCRSDTVVLLDTIRIRDPNLYCNRVHSDCVLIACQQHFFARTSSPTCGGERGSHRFAFCRPL